MVPLEGGTSVVWVVVCVWVFDIVGWEKETLAVLIRALMLSDESESVVSFSGFEGTGSGSMSHWL